MGYGGLSGQAEGEHLRKLPADLRSCGNCQLCLEGRADFEPSGCSPVATVEVILFLSTILSLSMAIVPAYLSSRLLPDQKCLKTFFSNSVFSITTHRERTELFLKLLVLVLKGWLVWKTTCRLSMRT